MKRMESLIFNIFLTIGIILIIVGIGIFACVVLSNYRMDTIKIGLSVLESLQKNS